MSEVAVISLRGLVYFLDQNREWQAQGDGYSQVSLYHDTARDSYRVVAMSLKTKEASINSRIFKEMVLKKDNDTFFQWADAKNRYGVNFAEVDKAAEFEKHFHEIVEKLNSAPAPAGPPAGGGPPSGAPKRAPSFGGPPGGGSGITKATVPPQFQPTGRGTAPQGTPSRVATPPRPFARPQPPGRTNSNQNLTQSGGAVPTLSSPPPLQRGNSVSPVSNPTQQPPPAAVEDTAPTTQSPPAEPPATSEPTHTPTPSPTEEPPPKKVPPVVSPRGPRPALGSSNPTSSTPSSPSPSPRPFQPGQVSAASAAAGATARRGTPPLGPTRGESQRNVALEKEKEKEDEHRPEPTISEVSTMDLSRVNEDEPPPSRSAEVDTILSPKGEVALRRKQIIEKTPELDSSVLLVTTMMKEHGSLFDSRTDQVSAEVKCMVEFLEGQALETREIFAYRVISKHLLAPLLKSMRRKGAPHLPTDTDPHLVAEMLKISYEELPRRPFHFEKYEPEQSWNDLRDNNGRVAFIKKALTTVGEAEKQSLGILIALLVKTAGKSRDNGMDAETLAALFAPFVVDAKWLNHKIPPAVKLKQPFKI